jgi:hypothetical protein
MIDWGSFVLGALASAIATAITVCLGYVADYFKFMRGRKAEKATLQSALAAELLVNRDLLVGGVAAFWEALDEGNEHI